MTWPWPALRAHARCLLAIVALGVAGGGSALAATPPWCVITGQVVDARSRPVADATVVLTFDGGHGATTSTDSHGHYVLALASKWSAHPADLRVDFGTDRHHAAITVNAGLNRFDLPLNALPRTPVDAPNANTLTRPFFYVTDRAVQGAGFGAGVDARLHFGIFAGTVDVGSAPCRLFGDWSCVRGPQSGEPVRVSGVTPAAPSGRAERAALIGRLTRAFPPGRPARVLVFIHGFNQSFEQGAAALARLALTAGWDGNPAILYSWPSEGDVHRYAADSERVTAGASVAHFVELLSLIAGLPTRPQLYLFAHSMGNRLLLAGLDRAAALKGRIARIVYLAADVSADDFLFSARTRATLDARQRLYVSHNDIALRVSDCHNDSRRLGEGPTSIDQSATIFDATEVATPQDWGHTYFANTLPVAADLTDFVHVSDTQRASIALARLDWLGTRSSPALDPNEALFESALACSVVRAVGL